MAFNYQAPGIYIDEVSTGARPIEAVGTSTAAFIGNAPNKDAPTGTPKAINSWTEFLTKFVGDSKESTHLSHGVFGFYANGGGTCYIVNVGPRGDVRSALRALDAFDDVSIVAAPGYTDPESYDALLSHCETLKNRVAILDCPEKVGDLRLLKEVATVSPPASTTDKAPKSTTPAESRGTSTTTTPTTTAPANDRGGVRPRESDKGCGSCYHPWVVIRDPLNAELRNPVTAPPSGHIAGIYARTDATRGVHKAPANELVRGVIGLTYRISQREQESLNPNGINCIRFFVGEGIRVWGARTLAASSSEWRYINVRRLFIMIEESIARSTRWVVFEPNDNSLWKKIKRDVSAFLMSLWRQGALLGATPEEAFFVKCDAETNPTEAIDAGIVRCMIGIAPVKPAEFVVFTIGQKNEGSLVEVQA